MQDILYAVLYDLFYTALIIVAGYAAAYLKKRIAAEKLKIAEFIARDTVLYVQQVYGYMEGKNKYEMALARIEKLLNKRGIKVDAEEIGVFIESSIKIFKKEFGEQWKQTS